MAKQAAKRPKKRPLHDKLALVASFEDIPDAKAMLAHHDVPAAFARCGFYCVRKGQADWLFDKHPEKKVTKKVAEAGFDLLRAVIEIDQITKRLGVTADMGYHTELDANALAKAFDDAGFTIEPVPLSRIASIAHGSEPWPAVREVLEAGDTAIRPVLDALGLRDALTPPPASVAAVLASRIENKADLQKLKLVYGSAKLDLVACALPFVARIWKPKQAKTKPRDLPPELTTLLGAFDGIPALGVASAKEVGERHRALLKLAHGATGVGKRDWGTTPTEVRTDRFWRAGWIPFCRRPDDERIAIDLEPSARGNKGQIIGVQLNPPTLRRYRRTLGEWLWNEIETAWK